MLILNTGIVANEVLEWSRYRIASVIQVHPSCVRAQWVRNDKGHVDAVFDVDSTAAKGISAEEIISVVQRVWNTEGKEMLSQRLEGLKDIRKF